MTDDAQIRFRGGELGEIRPEIYGQFLSRRRWVADEALHQPDHPDAGSDGLRRTVVAAIDDLAPPVVRWPGGCTGTSYEWQRGIGPAQERERTVDWHFGYGVGNGFGTVEFVDFCRQVGAEPQINLTTGTGDLRDALAWVEYCNGTDDTVWANLRRQHGRAEPLDVRYWQIGNEEWGSWELGTTTPEANAARVREWAKAIKRLDPTQRVAGVGAFGPDSLIDWNLPLLRAAWEHLDYLTVHTYWPFDPAAPDGDLTRVLSGPYRDEQTLVALQGLIELVGREHPGTPGPKIAVTEWNCVDETQHEMSPRWRPGEARYRLVDALAVATFLNVMQRRSHSVGLADFAQTINVVGALLVTDDAVVRETVYWPLLMQRHHSGSTALDVAVSCGTVPAQGQQGEASTMPALDVSLTTERGGRRSWVSVVNRSSSATRVHLDLGVPLTGDVVVHQLTHPDPLARNTLAHPEEVTTVTRHESFGTDAALTLPGSSYTVLDISTASPLSV